MTIHIKSLLLALSLSHSLSLSRWIFLVWVKESLANIAASYETAGRGSHDSMGKQLFPFSLKLWKKQEPPNGFRVQVRTSTWANKLGEENKGQRLQFNACRAVQGWQKTRTWTRTLERFAESMIIICFYYSFIYRMYIYFQSNHSCTGVICKRNHTLPFYKCPKTSNIH